MSRKESTGVTRRDALKILGAGAAASLVRGSVRGSASSSAPGTRRADVVIVGSGFAGLLAARELVRRGKRVVVLDARNRVGGRVKAGTIAGHGIDLGGMWVGPKQARLMALLDEYSIARTPQYVTGKTITEIGGRRFVGEGESVELGGADDAELERMLARVRSLVAEVPLDSPWTARNAEEWDRVTVDEWLRAETRNAIVLQELRLMVRGLFTVEPSELSLLFFLSYAGSGGSLEEEWNVVDSAQAFHIPGGMHQLAFRIAGELGPAIVLGAPVTAIAQDSAGVTVASRTDQWHAQRAIVTVPLPLSARIAYDPALPTQRDALAQRSPMGSVIKYWVAYAQPFWRREGWNAMVESDEPPTEGFMDVSPPDESVGLLVGFIDAKAALEWTTRSTEERKKAIVERVVHFLGPKGAHPIDYVDNDWTADPWTRGCFGASMGPGVLTTLGPSLRAPFGRIHWAGTETSPVWSGYIEGAIRSGERAAGEVLGGAVSKSDLGKTGRGR